jgi:hypothetical protein
VIISHNSEFVSQLCPEEWVMDAGRLTTKGEAGWMNRQDDKISDAPVITTMTDALGNISEVKAAKKTLSKRDEKVLYYIYTISILYCTIYTTLYLYYTLLYILYILYLYLTYTILTSTNLYTLGCSEGVAEEDQGGGGPGRRRGRAGQRDGAVRLDEEAHMT